MKDLTAGSGLVFEDAGEHELKGVPDRWHLYRLAGALIAAAGARSLATQPADLTSSASVASSGSPAVEAVEDPREDGLLGGGPMEQRHRRADLHRIERAEDLLRRPALERGHDRAHSRRRSTQGRVGEVGARLRERADGERLRRRAAPEARDLGKDEPDPVAGLAATAQLVENARVDVPLGARRSVRGRLTRADRTSRRPSCGQRRNRPTGTGGPPRLPAR